ncbi:P-loop containing nucleoside triphosphate hydrolase protein, partial [Lophium mytilinum]
IPQEPHSLPGSIRLKLDPPFLCTDAQLTACLRKVSLHTAVIALGGLDAPLAESALSHGQRQLLSLTRAILKKEAQGARVLVLDEATSSLDQVTERTVQRVLREEFKGCIVVAVAHYIETIVDFNEVVVLVLKIGRMVARGRPRELL